MAGTKERRIFPEGILRCSPEQQTAFFPGPLFLPPGPADLRVGVKSLAGCRLLSEVLWVCLGAAVLGGTGREEKSHQEVEN